MEAETGVTRLPRALALKGAPVFKSHKYRNLHRELGCWRGPCSSSLSIDGIQHSPLRCSHCLVAARRLPLLQWTTLLTVWCGTRPKPVHKIIEHVWQSGCLHNPTLSAANGSFQESRVPTQSSEIERVACASLRRPRGLRGVGFAGSHASPSSSSLSSDSSS